MGNRFLLDTVLSVSAQHLALTEAQPSQSALPSTVRHVNFAQVHSFYLDRAIRGQGEAISSQVTAENSPAIFFTSLMLSISSIRAPHVITANGDMPGKGSYTLPTSWLSISNAVAPVCSSADSCIDLSFPILMSSLDCNTLLFAVMFCHVSFFLRKYLKPPYQFGRGAMLAVGVFS